MPGVAGKILGHGLVGVQPDLAETQTARLFLGQRKQPTPIPRPWAAGSTATLSSSR
jgi:hypothetical protein